MALNKMQKTLKRFSHSYGYEVLFNKKVEYKNNVADIDAVLITPFGVNLFSFSQLKKGELYGTKDDSQWVIVTKKERIKIDNLFKRNEQNVAVLREIFAKEGVYKVGTFCATVIDCKDQTKQINLPVKVLNVFSLKEFKKYLKGTNFEKENGCDVKRIAESIEKYKI